MDIREISPVTPSRPKARRRIAAVITREVQEELRWDTYRNMYPEAARLALPRIRRIIDQEIREYERRKPQF